MSESEPHINFLELLDGLKYPATKAEVVLHAEGLGASEEALDRIQAIPEEDYKTREDLLDSIDVIEDLPGQENLWSSAGIDEFAPELEAADETQHIVRQA